MGAQPDFIREQAIVLLDIVRRRWSLFLLPVALGGVLALLAAEFAPTKYSAESLILLTGANRNTTGLSSSNVQRASAIQQINAIDAWLKSDQVLGPLLPRLVGYKAPEGPNQYAVQIRILRASLSLELVGDAVLQVRLEGRKPDGLGKNLEIILARLMEGLTGPEQNVFSAAQFVVMRRGEELHAANAKLERAIQETGTNNPAEIEGTLQKLWKIEQSARPSFPGELNLKAPQFGAQNQTLTEDLGRKISDNPAVVTKLVALYGARQRAQEEFEAARAQSCSARSNYVGIFDSPDNLLIIGRPTDPVVGTSVGRKLAIAIMLLSLVGGGTLVFLVEYLSTRLQTRSDFEKVSGLPVVARVGRVPPSGDVAADKPSPSPAG